MKIIEAQSAVLSNYEVYTHLSGLKKQYAATRKVDLKTGKPTGETYKRLGPGNYETVVKEVLEYLTAKPSPLHKLVYDSTTIKKLLTRLRPYELTKAEVIMILNLRPIDDCTLNMIVEEMYSRFDEDQHQEMITIISEVLGEAEKSEGDEMDTAE